MTKQDKSFKQRWSCGSISHIVWVRRQILPLSIPNEKLQMPETWGILQDGRKFWGKKHDVKKSGHLLILHGMPYSISTKVPECEAVLKQDAQLKVYIKLEGQLEWNARIKREIQFDGNKRMAIATRSFCTIKCSWFTATWCCPQI